jgi:hypothetical protein
MAISRQRSRRPKALPYGMTQGFLVGAGFTPARNLTQPTQDLAQKARSPLTTLGQGGSVIFYSWILSTVFCIPLSLFSLFFSSNFRHFSLRPVGPTARRGTLVHFRHFLLLRLPKQRGDAARRSGNGGGAVFTDTSDGASDTNDTGRMTISHDNPDT